MLPLQFRSFSLRVLASCSLLCATAAMCQQFAPSIRIVDKIDERNLVTLKGNTHPAANAKNDLGKVSDSLPMTDLILVLSRGSAQQAAFDKFVASQYDSNSPNFHQWLTPEQVGANFGPSETDIATISNWLTGHGFSVDEVTKDHMSIRFSGTAGQVLSTFHTEIHNLSVKGVAHIGNMSDPQIPAALTTAVVGVKSLHNFFPRPAHHLGSQVTRDSKTGKWQRVSSSSTSSSSLSGANGRPTLGGGAIGSLFTGGSRTEAAAKPQYGINVSGSSPYLLEDVGPNDFATIYNIFPLWNKSTPIDGTGQTIAIAGTSDIDVGQAVGSETGANGNNDVLTFRNFFGLPYVGGTVPGIPANTPIRISGNSQQPLTICTSTLSTALCGIDDLVENSLDVEWSASVAKNAQIVLVASYPASASDDNLYDSESYIVNNVTAHIMNVSYGECELGNGTAGNVQYYDLWQTAAAEGISVFVAAGDSGSASCDDGYDFAVSGLTVSGLASTPFNTAVGGTDFNWCTPDTFFNTECSASPYWNSSNNTSQTSVNASGPQLGYVQETPWNQTCSNPLTLKWMQDMAYDIYGIPTSDISSNEQGCNFVLDYSFTGYYDGVEGLGSLYPYGEYVLDTVGGSGGASSCVVGNAVTNSSTGEMTGCSAGATSTGATTNPDTGAAQGSISLHNNGWIKPSWQINSAIPGLPTTDGVRDLPDVSFFAADGFISSSAYLMCASASDTNNAPCSYSSYSEPFYQEVGGTSVATPAMAGVMALINQRAGSAQGLANPQLYALAAKQTYSSCSAETVTTSSSCYFNDIDTGTIAMPCDAADSTPNCTATQSTLGYSDSTYGLGILTGYSAGSGYDQATGLGSLNVANVVNGWTSAVGTGKTTVTVTPTPGTVSVGQSVSVLVTVASSPSGGTTPTGSVTLSGGGYTSATETLSSGSYTFTIPAGSLSGGTDTLTANYSGDSSYAPNSGSGAETVSKLTATVSATPSVVPPNTMESNQTLTVNGTVTGSGATPTGTVTVLYGTTYTSLPATLTSGSYSVTITPNSLPGGTPDTLTVQYSGDANYNSASTTTSVDVIFYTVLTPTVKVTTAPPATQTIDSGSPVLVTVTVTGSGTTPSGQVTLSGGGYTSSSPATLVNGVGTFSIPANTLSSSPNFPTSDTLTAEYLGDANYAQAAGTVTLTVTQSGFSLSATTPAPVAPGSSTTTAVSVSSPTDYTGTVAFTSASCKLTGYPSGVTSSTPGLPGCALTGSGVVTVTDGSPSGTVTYTVSTTGTTTAQGAPFSFRPGAYAQQSGSAGTLALASSPADRTARRNGSGWFETAGGAALAALFFFILPVGSRKWRKMLSMLLLMAAVTLAGVGCGGGGGGTTQVTLATPTVTVTPSVTSLAVNSSLSVTVAVSGSSGTPTGGVDISGGGYSSGQQTLSSGSTTFTIPANSFTTIGTVTLTASYGGDSNYNPNTGTATITVNNVPTTAGTYTFTVTPTSSPSISVEPSTTFQVTVN